MFKNVISDIHNDNIMYILCLTNRYTTPSQVVLVCMYDTTAIFSQMGWQSWLWLWHNITNQFEFISWSIRHNAHPQQAENTMQYFLYLRKFVVNKIYSTYLISHIRYEQPFTKQQNTSSLLLSSLKSCETVTNILLF